MIKAYVIECRTGCTCCSSDNHYRGPYKTKEDAERRVAFFKNPDGGYCPIASQYARRGSYSVKEITVEALGDSRYIINDEIVKYGMKYIDINDDGSINKKYGNSKDEFALEIIHEMESYW